MLDTLNALLSMCAGGFGYKNGEKKKVLRNQSLTRQVLKETDFFASTSLEYHDCAKRVNNANKCADQYNILNKYFRVSDEFKQYLKQI